MSHASNHARFSVDTHKNSQSQVSTPPSNKKLQSPAPTWCRVWGVDDGATKMTNEELQSAILITLESYNKQEGGNVQAKLYGHLCQLLEEQKRRAQEKTNA